MFDNFTNIYDSFMNSSEYNNKNNLVTLKYNCRGAHQLKFIFINFISLIMNYFDLVMNDYDHCYELV